jgi:hypothetical protein
MHRIGRSALALLVMLGIAAAAGSVRAAAQAPAERWNTPAALALIARAREVRSATSVDPERRSYQATATGHVFFLVDRPATGQRTLIKADQVALEIFWRAPRSTKQRIVGQRDQKVLPTNIKYHLDHLTVVQDDFGDVIRIGDGDEVSTVLHPAAPRSDLAYDFALGDSLAIAFPGGGEVHVQEVRVRPKQVDRPGYVGSVFIDRASGAIVRMQFTFTPSSYIDSYLDYIRISLDNSLWEGKWWLPYKQEVEIRREFPQLDVEVGTVIRGRFDIGDYVLNPDLSDALFAGPRVTAVPEAQRKAYAFTEPLIPAVESEGLTPTPSLDEIRAQALRLTAGRYLSGVARLRPFLSGASEIVRWNRGEGLYLVAGGTWRPNGRVALQATGGWSFGRGDPELVATLGSADDRSGLRVSWNEPRDLGPFPGEYGIVNSLSALLASDDWLDPWFSSGAQLLFGSRPGGPRAGARLILERDRRAEPVLDADRAADFRPLPAIDEGWLLALEGHREWERGAAVIGLTGRAAEFDPVGTDEALPFAIALGSVAWQRGSSGDRVRLSTRIDAGMALGSDHVPEQERFHLGGRGTVPGWDYRLQSGDVFWLARAEASRDLLRPWLTGRLLGAGGAAGELARSAEDANSGLSMDRRRVLTSLGAGVGLLWDVIHVDVARGLDGGKWELVVSVDRRFRGWL